MKINTKNIAVLIFTSSIIGFTYNYLNPDGISLIKTERILQFEDENPDTEDSIFTPESINENSASTIEEELSGIVSAGEKNIITTPKAFDQPIAIKLARAYELFNNGIKFIDARPKEEFDDGHIKDAINIPFYQSEQYENVLNKISKDEVIITYCSGEDCDLSIMLGDELFEKGYKKVYVFYGGWNDWLDAGYPVGRNK